MVWEESAFCFSDINWRALAVSPRGIRPALAALYAWKRPPASLRLDLSAHRARGLKRLNCLCCAEKPTTQHVAEAPCGRFHWLAFELEGYRRAGL